MFCVLTLQRTQILIKGFLLWYGPKEGEGGKELRAARLVAPRLFTRGSPLYFQDVMFHFLSVENFAPTSTRIFLSRGMGYPCDERTGMDAVSRYVVLPLAVFGSRTRCCQCLWSLILTISLHPHRQLGSHMES